MPKLRVSIGICLVGFAVACSSSGPDSGQNRVIRAANPRGIEKSDEGITGLAAREVVRRQERVRRADKAALEANRASAEGDHEVAIRSYRTALDTLPASD